MPAKFRAKYGPWALIAGASEGIGATFAHQVAAKGLNLILIARRAKELSEVAETCRATHGIEVHTIALDLSSANMIDIVHQQTRDLEIGLVIYNAALSLIGPFMEHSLEAHLQEIDLNCRAPLTLAHIFGQAMLKRGCGGIVLLSSLSALQGSALICNYAATKAYNLVLAEGLWDELREHNVDVLACCAGATRTPGYLSSRPRRSGLIRAPEMEPEAVVAETLGALGRRSSIVPGRINRFAYFFMNRLLPHRMAIALMGNSTRAMYSQRP